MMGVEGNEFVSGGEMRRGVGFYKGTGREELFAGESVEEVVFKCFGNVYEG